MVEADEADEVPRVVQALGCVSAATSRCEKVDASTSKPGGRCSSRNDGNALPKDLLRAPT